MTDLKRKKSRTSDFEIGTKLTDEMIQSRPPGHRTDFDFNVFFP